jgi:hypothetical protein
VALPGTLMPSPVSAVTVAENFSAPPLGSGHLLEEMELIVGGPMVVVLPLSQLMVPPFAGGQPVSAVAPPG